MKYAKEFSLIMAILFIISLFPANTRADGIPEPVAAMYRSNIVSQAESYLGTPYVYGGMSSSGVDCSGLCLLVYQNVGFMAWNNYAHSTYSIHTSLSNSGLTGSTTPQHTGCLFFSNSYAHMGIYVGGGEIIHAPGSGSVVSKVGVGNTYREYYKPVSWMY